MKPKLCSQCPAKFPTTITVTVAWLVPPDPVAVRVYVVVTAGETLWLPGVATPFIPWSIVTAVALVTAPQASVAAEPTTIVQGAHVKEEMTGASGKGVRVGVGEAAVVGAVVGGFGFATLIAVVRLVPKNEPSGPFKRQLPTKEPGVVGALIVSEISTSAPGAAGGRGADPATKAIPPLKAME
jgi:hypothetical protein